MAAGKVKSTQTNAPPQANMTNNHLTSKITNHLKKYGVTLTELHDGTVQFLGKYGSILLSKDIATLRPKHIDELCRLIELIQRRPSQMFGRLPHASLPERAAG
jgi:hypothetical protein